MGDLEGSYVDLVCLWGDASVFAGMEKRVRAPSKAAFDDLVAMLAIVVFELIGKVRNAVACGDRQAIPLLAVEIAQKMAFTVGAANRHCFTTGTQIFVEVQTLSPRPAALDDLVALVQSGELSRTDEVVAVLERAWRDFALMVDAADLDWGDRLGWPLADFSLADDD